jgi:ribosomal 30S subunit maturation factor RimM
VPRPTRGHRPTATRPRPSAAAKLWLARKDLPPLKADEFYLADLIGLPVERLRPDGRLQPLGTVIALTSNGAQDLLEVEYEVPGRRPDTWLLPVLPQFIVEVEGRLRVDLPIGMLPDASPMATMSDREEPGA